MFPPTAPLLLLLLTICSQGAPVLAIAGGTEAAGPDWASTAIIFYELPMTGERRAWCGATLIRPSVLLTAGHCLADGVDEMLAGVQLGSLQLDDPAAVRRNISRYTLHPGYYNSQARQAGWTAPADPEAPPRLDNDVALAFLDEPVAGVPLQALAAAGNATELEPGQPLRAAGWGKVPGAKPLSPGPNALLAAELEFVAADECRDWFAEFNQTLLIDPAGADLCAGSGGANSTCSGDSGGPLLDAEGVQVGLTSHGLFGELARQGQIGGCGSSGHLTAFSSIAFYKQWIDEQLQAEGLL